MVCMRVFGLSVKDEDYCLWREMRRIARGDVDPSWPGCDVAEPSMAISCYGSMETPDTN